MDDIRAVACATIDAASENLHQLSDDIWKNPELLFEEVHAHQVLTDFLESNGFSVTRSYILDTAFKAEFGTDNGPNIAIMCEYDALPVIGHACGHNLIAEVGVAAGLAVMAALNHCNKKSPCPGKNDKSWVLFGLAAPLSGSIIVTILGSPAEEGGGGKVKLIDGGAFDGIDAALMAHPADKTISMPLALAFRSLRVEFHGKASHSSGCPWEGINALDAAVTAYQSVSNLRQQFKPTYRVHGIISKGGVKPNIIPDHTELEYYVRAPTAAEVNVLYDKVVACCQAAAMATGCTMSQFEEVPIYKNIVANLTIAKRFEHHCDGVDLPVERDPNITGQFGGSTDMGNVTHHLPAIHPKFFVAPHPLHTRDFAHAAGLRDAQTNTLKVAKVLALTALDLIMDPNTLAEAKKEFTRDVECGMQA